MILGESSRDSLLQLKRAWRRRPGESATSPGYRESPFPLEERTATVVEALDSKVPVICGTPRWSLQWTVTQTGPQLGVDCRQWGTSPLGHEQ